MAILPPTLTKKPALGTYCSTPAKQLPLKEDACSIFAFLDESIFPFLRIANVSPRVNGWGWISTVVCSNCVSLSPKALSAARRSDFFPGLMLVIRLRELNKSCTNYASRKEFVITHDHEKLGAAATYRTDSKCLRCVGCLCCPGYIHRVVCVGCRYCLHQSSNNACVQKQERDT